MWLRNELSSLAEVSLYTFDRRMGTLSLFPTTATWWRKILVLSAWCGYVRHEPTSFLINKNQLPLFLSIPLAKTLLWKYLKSYTVVLLKRFKVYSKEPVTRQRRRLKQECPTTYGKGSQLFLWTCTRAARAKITISGTYSYTSPPRSLRHFSFIRDIYRVAQKNVYTLYSSISVE